MAINQALKTDLSAVQGGEFDGELHARFLLWKDQSGRSANTIATMINRSSAAVSQYINKKYPGSVAELERDIASLLRREEELEFVAGPRAFCKTQAAIQIWEVLQYCDQKQKMGAALAPSGTGKTETCKEYKRQNRATVFVTADITTRAPSQILRRIIDKVGGVGRRTSISDFLQSLIDKLRDSRRLVIIDDAHFLKWEAFELVRKLHDCARVGIVYCGQEMMYEQMRGQSDRAYLFDQIYSRIAIKRDKFTIQKKDVKAVAGGICAGLAADCMDYLCARARGKGRYRYVANLLDVALEMHNQYGSPLNLQLLQEAERFLLGG
ncbi:MAG: AAA family ATPase [Pseudomonadota bacterium]